MVASTICDDDHKKALFVICCHWFALACHASFGRSSADAAVEVVTPEPAISKSALECTDQRLCATLTAAARCRAPRALTG
jgi:hypothetical protein